MAVPGAVNLTVTQGEVFRQVFRWTRRPPTSRRRTPVDLTDAQARAQFVIAGEAALTFDSDPLTNPDGSIALTDDGRIELLATAAAVSAARHGRGDWSLEVDPPGEDRRVLLAGRVVIVREITL